MLNFTGNCQGVFHSGYTAFPQPAINDGAQRAAPFDLWCFHHWHLVLPVPIERWQGSSGVELKRFSRERSIINAVLENMRIIVRDVVVARWGWRRGGPQEWKETRIQSPRIWISPQFYRLILCFLGEFIGFLESSLFCKMGGTTSLD